MEAQETKLNQSNGRALYLLWAGLLISWFTGHGINIKVIFATAMLGIATIIIYNNFEKGVKFLHWVIVAGALYLLKFFPIEFFVGMPNYRVFIGEYFGEFGVGIELAMAMISYIHYDANRNLLGPYLQRGQKAQLTEEEKAAAAEASAENRKNHFKRKYANKSNAELKLIAEDQKYMEEAILAAKELLEEREQAAANGEQ